MTPPNLSQKIEEFNKKFTYASFAWNGDNVTGVKFAKKTKREILAFWKQAVTELVESLRIENQSPTKFSEFAGKDSGLCRSCGVKPAEYHKGGCSQLRFNLKQEAIDVIQGSNKDQKDLVDRVKAGWRRELDEWLLNNAFTRKGLESFVETQLTKLVNEIPEDFNSYPAHKRMIDFKAQLKEKWGL